MSDFEQLFKPLVEAWHSNACYPLAMTYEVDDIVNKAKQAALASMQGEAVAMHLACPACHAEHIDEGEWATRKHKTHQCQKCGHEWRPFEFATVGVTSPASAEIARLQKELEEARKDAEAVAWYRETAGGIAICYVQNEPPKDADGPWHPLCKSARKTWIPMDEQCPLEEHGNKVLGLADDGYVFQCEYVVRDGEGAWCNITGETMTHWMPLPRPDAAIRQIGGGE